MTTTSSRPVRFYVYNPSESLPASYHASFGQNGRDAFNWAVQNARRYHGRVVSENSDGSFTVLRSFERRAESVQDSV